MKNIFNTLSLSLLMAGSVIAQKEVKYEKFFYKDTKVETNDYSIIVSNAVSTDAETKFKIKIVNKTANYLIYKPEESKFTINGKTVDVKEKQIMIDPYESDFKVINAKGVFNTLKSYSFLVDGVYKVIPGTPIPAEDFKLPPSKNDVTAGPFTIAMDKFSKETAGAIAKFKCTYNGGKLGMVSPSKANMRMPDGKVYATIKKEKSFILKPGKDESFILSWDRMQGGGKANDLQFAEMTIMWNDMLNEASLEKTSANTVNLEFDETKSK